MEKNKIARLCALCLSVSVLAACGTKQQVLSGSANAYGTDNSKGVRSGQSDAVSKLTFVQKVSDNQVYAKNITGSMEFTLNMGDKHITVNGSMHMRKDELIRLQLFAPFLGFEVGRLEFAPDYVLIVDRIHKEYIKADYNQVDFLQKQGITFYSLQALFWNQLLLPGTKKVSESDLKKFDADLTVSGDNVPVTLQNEGMNYQWTADRSTGRITQADVQYVSRQTGTSGLTLKYSDFRNVGVKLFPAVLDLTLSTEATKKKQEANVVIRMNEVKTDSNWDTKTELSDKYKQVSTQDVINKIMSL